MQFAKKWSGATGGPPLVPLEKNSPLREYFDAHGTGRGIWKWMHYFEAYHRHFAKFVNRRCISSRSAFSAAAVWKCGATILLRSVTCMASTSSQLVSPTSKSERRYSSVIKRILGSDNHSVPSNPRWILC